MEFFNFGRFCLGLCFESPPNYRGTKHLNDFSNYLLSLVLPTTPRQSQIYLKDYIHVDKNNNRNKSKIPNRT